MKSRIVAWLSGIVVVVAGLCSVSLWASGGDGEVAFYSGGNLESDSSFRYEPTGFVGNGVLWVPEIAGSGEDFLTITAGSTKYGLVLEGHGGKAWQIDNNGSLWPDTNLSLGIAASPIRTVITDLPTSDPHVAGQLYRNGNNVRVSGG